MSRPINEEAPFKGVLKGRSVVVKPCITECGICDDCMRYIRAWSPPSNVVTHIPELPIKSRAEFYQVALREEGEAKTKLLEAEVALRSAQEAYGDASVQLTLTREGLFKACGL